MKASFSRCSRALRVFLPADRGMSGHPFIRQPCTTPCTSRLGGSPHGGYLGSDQNNLNWLIPGDRSNCRRAGDQCCMQQSLVHVCTTNTGSCNSVAVGMHHGDCTQQQQHLRHNRAPPMQWSWTAGAKVLPRARYHPRQVHVPRSQGQQQPYTCISRVLPAGAHSVPPVATMHRGASIMSHFDTQCPCLPEMVVAARRLVFRDLRGGSSVFLAEYSRAQLQHADCQAPCLQPSTRRAVPPSFAMPQQHLKVKKGDLKKKSAANKHGKGRAVTKKGAYGSAA